MSLDKKVGRTSQYSGKVLRSFDNNFKEPKFVHSQLLRDCRHSRLSEFIESIEIIYIVIRVKYANESKEAEACVGVVPMEMREEGRVR
jgi:hypothetical protein